MSLGTFVQTLSLGAIVVAFSIFQRSFLPPTASEYENDAEWRENFDYIIVGGGAGGSALARLLADDPRNFSILVIESGGAEDGSANLPLSIGITTGGKYDWAYRTVPQEIASQNTEDKTVYIPAGRALGGSSVLAYKMFIRGNKKDVDPWGDEFGCPEWKWDALQKYRLKMENMLEEEFKTGHGVDGLVPISLPDFQTPFADRWIKAGPELNFPQTSTQDYNLGDNRGFFRCMFMYSNSVLRSGAMLFLQTQLNTKRNIKILLNHHVKRVIFDNSAKATGVEYFSVSSPNDLKTINANKEIIISAGAMRTPQILHFSGVGPKKILANLKENDSDFKEILENENVGKNFHDHTAVAGLTAVIRDNASSAVIAPDLNLAQYFLTRTGAVVDPFAIEGLAMIQSNVNTETDHPDLEMFMQPSSMTNNFPVSFGRVVYTVLGFPEQLLNEYYKNYEKRTTVTVQLLLTNMKSRGSIVTESSNPLDRPTIDLQYLSDAEGYDLKALVDGVRQVRRVFRSNAFKDYIEDAMNASIPGCEEFFSEPDSDEYLECWVKRMSHSSFHPCCSSALGSNATRSVVDCKLRVHGVKNLRVVDASVFPVNVRGHTLAMTFLAAYKAADMILQDA